MMKLITTAIILININLVKSQISSNYIIIISSVYKYSYSSGKFDYKANLNFYGNALATMQARYDYYYKMINNSWGTVYNCKLINEYNNELIKLKCNVIQAKMNANNSYRNIDLAKNGAFAENLSAWMTDIFNLPEIKNEIELLKAINSEYMRLKNSYPDDFYKRERYQELITVLSMLQTCKPKEINNLQLKYGLW